jgi:hypothetical protein
LPPRKTLNLKKPPVSDPYIPLIEMPKRKIAIVGCYPESWHLAPFTDDSWEIWGFSRRNMGKLPRCDKWFELHEERMFDSYERVIPGYMEWLKRPGTVLQKDFPKDEILARFGEFFFEWGQCPWMLAYAITLNPSEIGIWGVESIDRYASQRYGIQHFVQLARDLGIKVTVPDGCTLLEPRKLYAFPPALAT